ncbi:3-methyladenine DNA glycosylase [Gordonia pseudamarae]|jgi:hypothetical protein|uniref:3-methyladenine DNA glycosylase n=1 Tax=Gordonia pseudamarae TaxID=2831662 RepID=UPI0038994BB7
MPTVTTTLAGERWRASRAAHTGRVDALIGPYLRERRSGRKHPVVDFLFTYYGSRPAHVTRWHPGLGVALDDADEYLRLPGYVRGPEGVQADPALVVERAEALRTAVDLLSATNARPARLGCFGLHEWAMVFRTDRPRHSLPLRLGAAGTDAVVESMPLRCTHFDAFRFFTPAAEPLNERPLSRASQLRDEQPGCLHTTMDLYRTCLRMIPLIESDLTFEAFRLALNARELDMCASPYDLTALGYDPVCVETPAGRAEYVRRQSDIADRGRLLRESILDRLRGIATTTHCADTTKLPASSIVAVSSAPPTTRVGYRRRTRPR